MKVATYEGTYRLQACIFADKRISLYVFSKIFEKCLEMQIQRISSGSLLPYWEQYFYRERIIIYYLYA